MTQQWAKENRASTSCIIAGNSDNQTKALPRVPGRQERTGEMLSFPLLCIISLPYIQADKQTRTHAHSIQLAVPSPTPLLCSQQSMEASMEEAW